MIPWVLAIAWACSLEVVHTVPMPTERDCRELRIAVKDDLNGMETRCIPPGELIEMDVDVKACEMGF